MSVSSGGAIEDLFSRVRSTSIGAMQKLGRTLLFRNDDEGHAAIEHEPVHYSIGRQALLHVHRDVDFCTIIMLTVIKF